MPQTTSFSFQQQLHKITQEPNWNWADLTPSPYVDFSRFALFELFTNRQMTQELTKLFNGRDEFDADSVHDNIFKTGAGSNLTKGMFVHLIEWTYPNDFAGADGNKFASKFVTKYTRRIKSLVSGNSGLSIVYASETPLQKRRSAPIACWWTTKGKIAQLTLVCAALAASPQEKDARSMILVAFLATCQVETFKQRM